MSNVETWKTIGLQILQVYTEECGDGSCGCGYADIPIVAAKIPKEVAKPQECCEPVCGPEICG
jgi:hypothetical protein